MRLEFGYNPPTGHRGYPEPAGGQERIDPATFVHDLERVLDVASQGFSSFWVADHHMFRDHFRLDCWTQLTWMAARYPRQRLGTCVMANSYRHPPLLAKMAASLQLFSHGRLVLGYGAGWHREEYVAYGYDFPPTPVRIEQLAEGIDVIRALWRDAPATYQGKHYRVAGAYCEPRPVPVPPIMVAGDGETYLLRVVAERADGWLSHMRPPAVLARKIKVLEDHCQIVGRDPDSIWRATQLAVYLDRDRRKAVRWAGPALERADPAFAGDPAALVARLTELADLGFRTVILSFVGFPGTDDLALFMDEVLPAFA